MDFLCKALTLTLAVFIKAESCEGEIKYMHDTFSLSIINQTRSVHVIFYSWNISTMGENHKILSFALTVLLTVVHTIQYGQYCCPVQLQSVSLAFHKLSPY